MRCKKIVAGMEFRLMQKAKGSHLGRPQIHFGSAFDFKSEYYALSDSTVIELVEWLSRYIRQHVEQSPNGEVVRASRAQAQRIIKNMNRLEGEL